MHLINETTPTALMYAYQTHLYSNKMIKRKQIKKKLEGTQRHIMSEPKKKAQLKMLSGQLRAGPLEHA